MPPAFFPVAQRASNIKIWLAPKNFDLLEFANAFATKQYYTNDREILCYVLKVYQVIFRRLHWQKLFLTSTRGQSWTLVPRVHPFADQDVVWCKEGVFVVLISILRSEQKHVGDECEWKLWVPLEEDWERGIINMNMGSFRSRQVGDVLSGEPQTQGLSVNTGRIDTLSLKFQVCWAENLFRLFIFSEMFK